MTAEAVPVLLYEGASAFQAAGALAALRAAGRAPELVSGDAIVPTLEGARVVPARIGYDALPAAPALVVPGGELGRALHDAALVRALRERRGRFTLFAGDALRLAAAAGLVEGRRVARLPGDAPLPGAVPVASRLVADGRLLTCFDGDPLVDLVLHYVTMADGAEAAAKAAARLGRELRSYAYGAAPEGGGA